MLIVSAAEHLVDNLNDRKGFTEYIRSENNR